MEKRGWISPSRLDLKGSVAALKELEEAAKQAGEETAKSARWAEEAVDRIGAAAARAAQELGGVVAAGQALKTVPEGMREVLASVKKQANGFGELNRALKQGALSRGQGGSSPSDPKAENPGGATGDWSSFRERVLFHGGPHLEGPHSKLDATEGQHYQAVMGEYFRRKGIAPEDGAEFAGKLVQFEKGPTTSEALHERAGHVLGTLEKSPVGVQRLLPQVNRLLGHGFAPEEASQAVSLFGQFLPGEEGAHAEAGLRAVDTLVAGGRAGRYGVEAGMKPYQKMQALARNVESRTREGENLETVLAEISPDSPAQKSLHGLVTRGVRGGELEAWRRVQEESPARDFAQVRSEIRAIENARRILADARLTGESAVPAESWSGAHEARLRASAAPARPALYSPGRDAETSGQAGETLLRQNPPGGGVSWDGASSIAAETRDILKQIAARLERLERRDELRASPPLFASPPRPRGRMDG
jgi:hypothetical protein